MAACKDCPISLVCIATDLHFSKRKYEHCRSCGKCWISYWTTNMRWRILEAPCHLDCPTKLDVITCERCIYAGIRQKHPTPDSLLPGFTATRPIRQQTFQFMGGNHVMRPVTNLLELPILNVQVQVTPAIQPSLKFTVPLHVGVEIDEFKSKILDALAVPSKYLDKKGKP